VIGLWFTLRTHAALIWATEAEEKRAVAIAQDPAPYEPRHLLFPDGPQASSSVSPNAKASIRESQLYKRILGQSLKQVGLPDINPDDTLEQSTSSAGRDNNKSPYLVPPRPESAGLKNFSGLSSQDNENLVRQVTEVAATAAAVAARDAARARKPSIQQPPLRQTNSKDKGTPDPVKAILENEDVGLEHAHASGGHDAPNWSRTKSSIVLLGATVLYAIIAEILVNTVDVVLESVDIDEKFLGITLFALVPNTTEFLVCCLFPSLLYHFDLLMNDIIKNAISFAMNGNIALSMEIGSAYALQVCLLQIPALVLFSAFYGRLIDQSELLNHSFKYINSPSP